MIPEGLTIRSAVADLDSILNILEFLNSDDGAEDLLLVDLHVGGDVGEDGRLDEVTLGAVTLTTDSNGSTSILTVLDVLHDAVELELRNLGTLEGVLGEGVTDLVLQSTLLETRNELVVDAFLNQDTGTSAAALTVVVEDTEVGPGDSVVNVGIIEDNVGGLATQLEGHLFEVTLGGGLEDSTTNKGGASEGDLVDVHVVRDGGTGHTTETGDDVNHTGGDASLLDQLGSIETGQRSLLGSLEDNSVTGSDGRTDLPGPHQQGEVPGDDLSADTDGFVASVVQGLRVGVDGLTMDLVGPATIVAQATGSGSDITLGHGDRLAIVQGFDGHQDLGITLEKVGELGQHAATGGRSDLAPFALEGLASSSNGGVHILLRGLIDGDNGLLGGGVDGLESLAIGTLDEFAVNEPVK